MFRISGWRPGLPLTLLELPTCWRGRIILLTLWSWQLIADYVLFIHKRGTVDTVSVTSWHSLDQLTLSQLNVDTDGSTRWHSQTTDWHSWMNRMTLSYIPVDTLRATSWYFRSLLLILSRSLVDTATTTCWHCQCWLLTLPELHVNTIRVTCWRYWSQQLTILQPPVDTSGVTCWRNRYNLLTLSELTDLPSHLESKTDDYHLPANTQHFAGRQLITGDTASVQLCLCECCSHTASFHICDWNLLSTAKVTTSGCQPHIYTWITRSQSVS